MDKVITLPLRLHSEANLREHWRKAYARHKRQKDYVTAMLRPSVSPMQKGVVRLVRVAPRAYDYDNMVYSFKSIRDAVADILKPGLPPGRADGDPSIDWQYAQEKGKTCIRIELHYED